mmetsp:Transcript_10346/g.15885  ORF Transcript_10346/g.15885 Transcript_10346/m.15885 type:complete len:81 (-) Transcript_10346:3748-3990(-)
MNYEKEVPKVEPPKKKFVSGLRQPTRVGAAAGPAHPSPGEALKLLQPSTASKFPGAMTSEEAMNGPEHAIQSKVNRVLEL